MKYLRVNYSNCFYNMDNYVDSDSDVISIAEDQVLRHLFQKIRLESVYDRFREWVTVDEVWEEFVDDEGRTTLVEIYNHESLGADHFNKAIEEYKDGLIEAFNKQKEKEKKVEKRNEIERAKRLLAKNGLL